MKEKPEQDTNLFRQALEDVVPLKPSNRLIPKLKPLKVTVRNTNASTNVADTLSDHGAGDIAITEFLRNGISRMTLRKLRRGEWPPQDSLDLHGLSNDEARKSLVEFLHHSTQRGMRCIEVIHGKGWRSEGRDGILKVHTRYWLMQPAQVLAFCEAPLIAGGSGAVWVFLKYNSELKG